MTSSNAQSVRRPLRAQLVWFNRLRWAAGLSVVAAGVADGLWLHWFGPCRRIVAVGVLILAYNAVLTAMMRRPHRGGSRRMLLTIAWAQVLLDLACLSSLTVCTGGLHSPLLGLFVPHMVFASLLLAPLMAYAVATFSAVALATGLVLGGRWPTQSTEHLIGAGWVLSLIMTIYVANHITHLLRRHERWLRRQNARVRRMSRRLRDQQDAMIQHEKMVAMGRMAAGVAHEIANPLANMDSVLQLMQRNPDRARPEMVQTLREQIERISQIVAQLTSTVHPRELDWQRLPFNEVVAKGLDLVRFDRRVRAVEVVREFSPDVGEVCLLPQSVQQILINLVLNALDAMADSPQPRLTIRTGRDGDEVWVAVEDNGHGIEQKLLSRIFEPSFTTKPLGEGTGLGLSISVQLADRMGGRIDVARLNPTGARFIVRIPLRDGPPE